MRDYPHRLGLCPLALIVAGLGCGPSKNLPPQGGVTRDSGGPVADAASGVTQDAASVGARDAASVSPRDSASVGEPRDAAGPADAAAPAFPVDGGTEPEEDELGEAAADGADDALVYTGPLRPPAVCSPSATPGTGVLLGMSTSLDDILDAVTPDELTMAWTIGHGSTATLVYADRTDVGSAFEAPQTVTMGPFATDRAAISPDGLRLVVVGSDGQGFFELTRASRTAPGNAFGVPGIGTYANFDAVAALSAGQSYGDPVLSADDVSFYYTVSDGGLPVIFRTARLLPADNWPLGDSLHASDTLSDGGTLGGKPTGIATDEQTLFLTTTSGVQIAAWLDDASGAFRASVDLTPRVSVAPSADCHHLYYSAQGAGSVDLFVAPQ